MWHIAAVATSVPGVIQPVARPNFLDLATMKILMQRSPNFKHYVPDVSDLSLKRFGSSQGKKRALTSCCNQSCQRWSHFLPALKQRKRRKRDAELVWNSSWRNFRTWHGVGVLIFTQDDGRVGGLFKSLTRGVKAWLFCSFRCDDVAKLRSAVVQNITGGAVLTEEDLEL